jgi:hypothetical protein
LINYNSQVLILLVYSQKCLQHSINFACSFGKNAECGSEHPTYSTAPALCEFFLFPTKKFEGMEDTQKITMAILKNLQENEFWK